MDNPANASDQGIINYQEWAGTPWIWPNIEVTRQVQHHVAKPDRCVLSQLALVSHTMIAFDKPGFTDPLNLEVALCIAKCSCTATLWHTECETSEVSGNLGGLACKQERLI